MCQAFEEVRNEGREEGREEGRTEGFLLAMAGLVKEKILTPEEAARRANITPEEFTRRTGSAAE